MTYADHVYEIVLARAGGLDSIYKDYIEQIVGTVGLNALLTGGYLESCGVIADRQLFVLVDRSTIERNKRRG